MAPQPKSPAVFAREMRAFPAKLDAAQRKATFQAGLEVKKHTVRELRQAIGPEQRLSGVGGAKTKAQGGAKLNVQVTERGKTENIVVRATGPWQIVENATQSHRIIPRGLKGRSRQRAIRSRARTIATISRAYGFDVAPFIPAARVKPLALPFGFRMGANHPGTRGKQPWKRGVDRAIPKVAPIYQKAVRGTMRNVFG